MDYMFNGCTYLESVNISNIEVIWDSSYINMNYMFNGCIYLESINISNIMVSRESYINMNYMFNSCIYLVSINLSNIEAYWDSYINMNHTFSVCKNLRYLHFSFNQEYNVDNIFIFNDVPENIVYCFNKEQNLNNLLSKKKCFLFDCTDNWIENQKKIIFKNNTCIDDCASHSLVDYKNFCYDFCPNRTHKDGFICKDCYPSCEVCEQPGTDEIHNCISCKKGYNLIYHKENNTVNCYKYRYNRSEIYNIYVTKIPVAYNFISHLLFCLDNCTNTFIYKPNNECNKICINNNKYFCDINCPKELLLELIDFKNCKYSCSLNDSNNIIYLFDNENLYKKEKTLNYILNILENKFSNNLSFNEEKYISFEEQNYKYIITSNKNDQYNNYKNIKEFMECGNNIKEKYQLANVDSLYLLMILKSSKEISYIETEYEIYYFFDKLYIQDICNFTIKEDIINDTKTSNYIIITNTITIMNLLNIALFKKCKIKYINQFILISKQIL